jgi:hypothetical protein
MKWPSVMLSIRDVFETFSAPQMDFHPLEGEL